MTVYKYFLKAALRQKWIILGYTAIFLVLSIINGASTETEKPAFMEKDMEIGIVDESRGDLSKELIDYLDGSNTLIRLEKNIENIKEQIFLEALDAVIIIPKNFEVLVSQKKPALEIFKDDRKMAPLQVENEVNKFLVFANSKEVDGTFDLEKVKETLNKEVEVKLMDSDKMVKNKNADDWFKTYFNFTGYIIIAIYVAVIGLIMTEFNDKKIQDRMKISSKRFLRLNMEIHLGQVIVGVVITFLIILGGIVLKGKHIGQVNFLKYVVNVFIFSFAILCFTFLINNLTKSKFVINGMSTVASLGTAFISGIFVPQEFLGEGVLRVAKFFPTYYFVRINETHINSFFDVKYELFMQVLFALTFLLMGLYFSKIKQKS
ncbi:MAG: ABC transporter permease [Tissierella sp.]|uniref:ABC transporter permease n=1 Tax=Tissierella sp. TaxID=41274 RepID=UPI003F9B9D09